MSDIFIQRAAALVVCVILLVVVRYKQRRGM